MTIELWLPFTLAAALILIIPGPTILLVISQAVALGRKTGQGVMKNNWRSRFS